MALYEGVRAALRLARAADDWGPVCRRAMPAEWVLEEGATDQSDAEIARELVREQLFRRLNQELPYSLEPEHVSQRTLADNSVRIEQVIWVPNETVRRV